MGINRTFMELKQRFVVASYVQTNVLIEPLWNWNDIIKLNKQHIEKY